HSEGEGRTAARISVSGHETRRSGLYALVGETVIAARILLAVALAAPYVVRAQAAQPLPVATEEATPIGALPPMPLPMPASRDQNYWGFRLQYGLRNERAGPEDLFAGAPGVDYRLRGGSL